MYDSRVLIAIRIFLGISTVVLASCWALFPSGNRFDAYAAIAAALFAISTAPFGPRSQPSLTPHDQQLLRDFRALFANGSLIKEYEQADFLLPFRHDSVRPLYTVAEIWSDAAHSFVNAELEARRKLFVEAATALAMEISGKTIPDGANVTVIPRRMNPERLSDEVKQDAKAINAKVPAFVAAHDELLRTGNRLGGIPATPASTQDDLPPKYKPEPPIPLTPASVFAFLLGNARLLDLTEELITRRKLERSRIDTGIAWLDERLRVLDVKTIRELDEYVERHWKAASRLSSYFSPQGGIDSSFLLQYVLDIVVIESGGLEGLREHYRRLKYSPGGDSRADYIFSCYREIADVQ